MSSGFFGQESFVSAPTFSHAAAVVQMRSPVETVSL